MHPTKLDLWIGMLLAMPTVTAWIALSRVKRASLSGSSWKPERQLVGLRLLFTQTLVPLLQVLPLLRSVTSAPSQLANASVILLPVASLLLGIASFYFLVRYSRGLGQIFLPALNLLVFTYSAALLIAAGATA